MSLLGWYPHIRIAVALAGAMTLAAPLHANDRFTPVRRQVSSVGLNLNTEEGAQRMYQRLKSAARSACSTPDPVKKAPSWVYRTCMEEALAKAIRDAHLPYVVQAFIKDYGAEAERYLTGGTQFASK